MNFKQIISEILNQGKIGWEEALFLAHYPHEEELFQASCEVFQKFGSKHFDLCSIINARSGKCSENCKWCAQSMHHSTSADIYPLLGLEPCLEMAQKNEELGIARFSLVTSGRKLSSSDLEQLLETVRYLKQHTHLFLCASLGLMQKEELARLKEAGIERFHCNLETAPSYFSQLCTTHTPEEKIQTLQAAREVGMDICSGGIIGMGENWEERIELAITLRDLEVQSIPVNILQPIPGTPLENMPPLSETDILKTFALFRLINPQAYIRFAGGRSRLSETAILKAFQLGVNAAIVGDMLTTVGSDVKTDQERLRKSRLFSNFQ